MHDLRSHLIEIGVIKPNDGLPPTPLADRLPIGGAPRHRWPEVDDLIQTYRRTERRPAPKAFYGEAHRRRASGFLPPRPQPADLQTD